MHPYDKDELSPMVKLIKHEEFSKLTDLDMFYTEEQMNFYMADRKDHIRVYVPRGYLTDGATVPEALQRFFPVWDVYYQAAVFHDYLCEYLTIYVNGVATKITRTEADAIFNRIMKHINTPVLKRKLVYAGVVSYSHFKAIVYPSAQKIKHEYEDKIREDLDMRDKAREDQKKKTA